MNILHCDLDAFYASVEQRDRPELANCPVVVGGMPGSRGVVSTCSYEARKYGVHSAMPSHQAYRLCPHAVFLPPDLQKYSKVSAEVFSLFERYTPIIEPLSIDEAFLDVSGSHRIFGTSLEIAREIKKAVQEEIGLVISIGIAKNKYLAKLATNLSKPDGLMLFGEQEIQEILPSLPVKNMWGIGAKTAASLNHAGFYSIGDIAAAEPKTLQTILGKNTEFYIQLARGIDLRTVECRHEAKSIGNEITFSHDIDNSTEIEQVILELACKVGFRLRRLSLQAYTINLKLRTENFKTYTRSLSLPEPSNADMLIYQTAAGLYKNSGLSGEKLRLIGVSCSKLVLAELEQPSLFNDDKSPALDKLLDDLRLKFGQHTVHRASLIKPDKHE